jgi:hypothetical protein
MIRGQNISIFKTLSMPISYRVLSENRLFDAQNVFDAKGITETRPGIRRYNSTSLGGEILSASFFKTTSGTRHKLAKVAGSIYAVSASGASSAVKTGLSTTTKHRGVTTNNRHIIAIENDGLYSYNGTTFTQLGQAAPTGASAAVSNGGSLTDANNFKVGLTFYSSSTGFETNVFESNQVTTANPNKQIDVTGIPTTAANATIDTVRIYLKNVTAATAYLFVAEISLGTASYTITTTPTSTQVPPTTHAAPLSGGGKYIAIFGKKIVYAGNSTFPNDVFFSEEYLPDAFNDTDTASTLNIEGQGPITGLAVGLYNDQDLAPFLAIFKRSSITIYSELAGSPSQVQLDTTIGCVSHDTIKVKSGVIYFLSESGWYCIKNGQLVKNERNEPTSLGLGDVDDIFTREGWTNQLNSANYSNFFSAYYTTFRHYMTFVGEGTNNSFYKAYVYEMDIGGFRVFTFKTAITCACEGEDDNGNQCVFFGDRSGTLFTYSIKNSRHDENSAGTGQSIPAYVLLPYFNPKDIGRSSNWKILNVRALSSANTVTVKTWKSFSTQAAALYTLDFPNSSLGFTLDVSQLDQSLLGDERVPVTKTVDITQTAETLLIGFYQDTTDANIALITAEVNFTRNNNRNL